MPDRMKVHLVDGCFYAFGGRSATLGGDNAGLGPQSFEWTTEPTGDVTFYTDICLEQAVGQPGRKVAWLIEPPWKPGHYNDAYELRDEFDYILTYFEAFPNINTLFYPHGGSWIKAEDWGVFDKTESVSLIASEKKCAPGHWLRHDIAKFNDIDLWGRGYQAADSKVPMLRPYRYSVVVESWRGNFYFTEKLIDCISQGTVPIYWGCPELGAFFNRQGIIEFRNLDELKEILKTVANEADYQQRLPAIRTNLELAKRYRCAEDWIYREYPQLFN